MYFYVHIHEDNSRISIQTEHKDIEILIKYKNKKWVTNSKGAPKHLGGMSSVNSKTETNLFQ